MAAPSPKQKLMVWAIIGSDGIIITPLQAGDINNERYLEMLEEEFARGSTDRLDTATYVQDGTRAYTYFRDLFRIQINVIFVWTNWKAWENSTKTIFLTGYNFNWKQVLNSIGFEKQWLDYFELESFLRAIQSKRRYSHWNKKCNEHRTTYIKIPLKR